MSAVEWTDAERGCCFGTCGGDIRQHAPHEDQGCAMFEDMLRYLTPHVAAREAQARVEALREEADDLEHKANDLIELADKWGGYYDGLLSGMRSTVQRLRGRADEMEAGEDRG